MLTSRACKRSATQARAEQPTWLGCVCELASGNSGIAPVCGSVRKTWASRVSFHRFLRSRATAQVTVSEPVDLLERTPLHSLHIHTLEARSRAPTALTFALTTLATSGEVRTVASPPQAGSGTWYCFHAGARTRRGHASRHAIWKSEPNWMLLSLEQEDLALLCTTL